MPINKGILHENFTLVVLAVGLADFDKSFHTSYYHNRDDLFGIRLSVSKQNFVDQNSFWCVWEVGVADFDKTFHTPYYHNRDDL